jgi:hypothetical protein
MNKPKVICVSPIIYERVKQRAHHGQILGGVIEELLDMADKLEGRPLLRIMGKMKDAPLPGESSNQPKANETMQSRTPESFIKILNQTFEQTRDELTDKHDPIVIEDKTTKPDKPQYADEE